LRCVKVSRFRHNEASPLASLVLPLIVSGDNGLT
jgi:hypothetical protein